MWKSSIRVGLLAVLLAAGSLVVPATTFAQGAQHNESDLDFSRRMAARLERLEAQADGLEEQAVRQRDYSRERATSAGAMSSQDDFGVAGGQSRMSSAGLDNYERIKLDIRSLQRKARKEREKLATVQGSKSKPTELDRDAIESRVTRMERDLVEVERDLRRR